MSKDSIKLSDYYFISYFRDLLSIKYAYEITNFLLKKSNLSLWEFEKKWDNFDIIFWEEYWNKISALSFATIIEARWKLLKSVLIEENTENNLTIELASGFTPRWLYLVNRWNTNYIETDKSNVIELKKEFYDYLNNTNKKTPKIKVLDVLKKDDFKNIYEYIKTEIWNTKINQITLVNEWLLIYLTKKEQKIFFENLKIFSKLLENINIKLNYITTDMPTHKNFTNWLVHEDFSFKDHLEVMNKVDPKIIESLYNTEKDFTKSNWISNIQKYYYSDEVINNLKTNRLNKYKKIPKLKEKINSFLKQDILYAWKYEL